MASLLSRSPLPRRLPVGIARRFASTESSRSVTLAVGPDGLTLHAVTPSGPVAERPAVLCLPSAFGSVRGDFRRQLESPLLQSKYALYGVDPRGYGGSRPPERDFPSRWFERDADDVLRAADQLQLDQFAVLGWSAGANVGAVLAATHPERAFVCDDDLEAMETYEDVSKWRPAAREAGEAIYGAGNLQEKWSEMMEALRLAEREDGGDLYCGHLPYIKCKTLVVSGARDKLVAGFHGEYLSERIMHSRLEVVASGRHDLVLSEAEQFNELLDAFLQEPDDKLTQSREFVAVPSKN
ncbi:hypothetical protein BBJ28_00013130 [Nothophytophthora sp. Chile5]|nr:hypothetical protein BBJ28_00013130 [Nothophytophthora sp. Chile5]